MKQSNHTLGIQLHHHVHVHVMGRRGGGGGKQDGIRTHASRSYVRLAPWTWFSFEHLKTILKHCLYMPAGI